MFGKPEWFQIKCGWCVWPTCRQGWIYTIVWKAVIGIPFLLILFTNGLSWSFPWLAFSMLILVWDMRTIAKAKKDEEKANLFYIGENDEDSHVSTRNYDLRKRE